MKTKITLLSLLLCYLFSAKAVAPSHRVSILEAQLIAERQFKGKDVDYYILQDNNQTEWTIFVDAEPMKGWEHECYIITIPKTSSAPINLTFPTSKVRRKLPPSGNYIPLSVKNRYDTNANLAPIVSKDPQANIANPVAQRTYAIILSGGIYPTSNYERYWNDCSFIYQTLVNKYGIPKDNIFPIMSDGDNPASDMRCTTGVLKSQPLDLDNDGVDEIKLSATKANVESTLNTLATKMQKDDHLFFFVIDHGGTTDNRSNSYICLWNYENLYDYQLANMLTPFTSKLVNVNVVLGQCFSGGFNDNLTKIGCVVSSASTGGESSYACEDIPYDEFVYQWTCAVNGATHRGVKVDADVDGNGRTTMQEAFDYAKKHDRIPQEHPQYISTPLSVGEDLAFNHLAPSIDLYVKDNFEDTGKEPNTTTDEFWKSPSIWVRNKEDGIKIHENPIYSSDHPAAIVYVTIHNRGKEKYKGGQWLHVYWAKASTGFSDRAWKGLELYNNEFVTGGHLEAAHIPEIAAGDSTSIPVTWALPRIYKETDNDKHHFCLTAKIMDTYYDDKYEAGKTYFDKRGSNDQAQINVSIIEKEDIFNGTSVFVRNINKQNRNYTLELRPATLADEEIYENANVELELSPTIYTAWERGGFKSQDIELPLSNSNNTNLRKVKFLSPQSKLQDVSLMGDEFDIVSLKCDFTQYPLQNKTYTFDLIQKDANGKIIGGETFIIEPPTLSSSPVNITQSQTPQGKVQLKVDEDNFKTIKWVDEQGNNLGSSESIIVSPTSGNKNYTVFASTDNGEVATESIYLDCDYGIKSVTTSSDSNNIIVELSSAASEKSAISVVSTIDGGTKQTKDILPGENIVSIDASKFTKGIYIITYTANGETIDQKKINLY